MWRVRSTRGDACDVADMHACAIVGSPAAAVGRARSTREEVSDTGGDVTVTVTTVMVTTVTTTVTMTRYHTVGA